MDWMQRAAIVLFYGVMALVAATCGLNLFPMAVPVNQGWFEAIGTWFGGVGSFVAAGAALYIAYRQRLDAQKDKTDERALSADLVTLQIALFSFDVSRSSLIFRNSDEVDIRRMMTEANTENEIIHTLSIPENHSVSDLSAFRFVPILAPWAAVTISAVQNYNREVRTLASMERRSWLTRSHIVFGALEVVKRANGDLAKMMPETLLTLGMNRNDL